MISALSGFARSRIALPVGFAISIVLLLVAAKAPEALRNDFLTLYSGGSLVLDGRADHSLYHPDVLYQRERQLMPDISQVALFALPPWYALALAPLSLLPYGLATYALWVALQIGLLALAWRWGVRRFGEQVIDFTCLYVPPMAGIAYGQDSLFQLTLILGAYVAATRRRDFAAGALLGLGLFQFQLFLLWPPLLLLNRRWKFLAGFCASGLGACVLSITAFGPGILATYAGFLAHAAPAINQAPQKMINLWGGLANLPWQSPALTAGCVLVCAVTLLAKSRQLGTDALFVRAAIGSVFLAPHVYVYHATLLLLPVWLMIFRADRPTVRTAARWFAKPYAFLALQLAQIAPLPVVGALAMAALFAASLFFVPGEVTVPLKASVLPSGEAPLTEP